MLLLVLPAVLGAGFSAAWRYANAVDRLVFRVPATRRESGAPPDGYEEVSISSRLGELPAWRSLGGNANWVIAVHGKGATRAECLPVLAAAQSAGWDGLAVTYRNDHDAPAAPAPVYAYGVAEWRDLEAALIFAREQGAERVVFAGLSMGGAIALQCLRRSGLAPLVQGLILDSPLLDLRATVKHVSVHARTPRVVVETGLLVAAVRLGLRWSRYDLRAFAASLVTPVLLIHGAADSSVPVTVSDRLARALGTRATYWRPAGVAHVRASRAEPERYRAAISAFLRSVEEVAALVG